VIYILNGVPIDDREARSDVARYLRPKSRWLEILRDVFCLLGRRRKVRRNFFSGARDKVM
jgi:hypothetical protein